MEQTFRVDHIDQLKDVAQQIIPQLKPGTVVCFRGEMGAGKTTFIKILLQEMGVAENIDSPTFALVNEYELPDKTLVFHFDLYRINSPQEALDIGFEEYLDRDALCLIEWPDVVDDLLPDDRVEVKIEDAVSYRVVSIAKAG